VSCVRLVEHEVKIETVPQRVARAALQLDQTGVNGSSFHAQTAQFSQDKRGSHPVQIPPRALISSSIAPSQMLFATDPWRRRATDGRTLMLAIR
jgi:hypothetical protein